MRDYDYGLTCPHCRKPVLLRLDTPTTSPDARPTLQLSPKDLAEEVTGKAMSDIDPPLFPGDWKRLEQLANIFRAEHVGVSPVAPSPFPADDDKPSLVVRDMAKPERFIVVMLNPDTFLIRRKQF